jgi:hypothetical protein
VRLYLALPVNITNWGDNFREVRDIRMGDYGKQGKNLKG